MVRSFVPTLCDQPGCDDEATLIAYAQGRNTGPKAWYSCERHAPEQRESSAAPARFVIDDGGRAAAGFSVANDAGDCVVRALTIACDEDYGVVYRELAWLSKEMGGRQSARDGVTPKVYKRWLADRGWVWTPTMSIGSGTTVHLRADELPNGRLVVKCSRHLVAVLDGVIHDTHDPSRGGTRAVYGHWSRP